MRIIWTPRAASDLEAAIDYITADNPEAGLRVANRIYHQVLKLASLPDIGRVGLLPGTRELIFHPWPYIVVYKVSATEIRVMRIRHASQQWPSL